MPVFKKSEEMVTGSKPCSQGKFQNDRAAMIDLLFVREIAENKQSVPNTTQKIFFSFFNLERINLT